MHGLDGTLEQRPLAEDGHTRSCQLDHTPEEVPVLGWESKLPLGFEVGQLEDEVTHCPGL